MAKAYIVAHAEIMDGQVVVTRIQTYSYSPEALSQDLHSGLAMLLYSFEAETFGEAKETAEKHLKRVREYSKPLQLLLEAW